MKRQQFEEIVRQVEAKYQGRPQALWRKTAWLAAMGYLSFLAWFGLALLPGAAFLIPGLLMGMEGIFVSIFGGILMAVIITNLIRILWVRVSSPKGYELRAGEAPELLAMIGQIRRALGCYRFHRIIVTPVLNAGVMEMPRLGVLGWNRNCLLLGMPLLDALSPDELKSVLAHEAAHLSGRHGWISGWIYRLRRSWQSAFEQLNRPRAGRAISLRPLITRFIEWYWPRFNAHAFVLSRQHEFEADAVAARLAGVDPTALALCRTEMSARFLHEKFWPDLWQLVKQEAAPPPDVFERLRGALEQGAPAEDAARWSADALNTITNNADTHPCLSERLRSLFGAAASRSEFPVALTSGEPTAAALLGAALPKVRRSLDELWQKEAAENWRNRRNRAEALSHRLEDISRVNTAAVAAPEVLWERICATLDLEGDDAAQAMLCDLLAQQPGHARANFHRGRYLLGRSAAEGEAYVRKAIELDEELVPKGCEVLHAYFVQAGRSDRLAELRVYMDRYEAAFAASNQERSSVSGKDSFLSHGLTEKELEVVRTALMQEPEVIRAELARKHLQYFTSQRLFVLCIRRARPWHGIVNEDVERALVRRLTPKIKLPGRYLVIAPVGAFGPVASKIAKIGDAVIFTKETL